MKKSNFVKALILLLALQFLVSCAAPAPQATATPTVAAPNETATPTLQPIIECQGHGVLEDMEPDFGFPGAIVYFDTASLKYTLVGGEPFQTWETLTPEIPSQLIGFSPNGKWLAYMSYPTAYHLLSFDGERRTVFPKTESLQRSIPEGNSIEQFGWSTWVSDQVVSVYLVNPNQSWPNNSFTGFLDLFSSKWTLLNTYTYRDMDFYKKGLPSPDMTRFLYARKEDDWTYTLALMDIASGEELWNQNEISNMPLAEGSMFRNVAWSNGSEKVAFIDYTYERQPSISIWSRDGKVIKEFSLDREEDVSSIRWSPDGEYLAMGVSEIAKDAPNWSNSSILIYSLNLNQFIFSCPIAGHKSLEEFTWGPEGSAIIYFADYGVDEVGKIIYLDLVHGTSTLITNNVSQFGGWSAEFKQQ